MQRILGRHLGATVRLMLIASEDTRSLETHVNDVGIRKRKTHQIESFMEC